ncbi:hypothetical protein, partial [Mesorhizobium japonicum]|uniref:hypothetical protein n=1 Tax=Mesorhizobium japonicum TaxID=2066070 RepID=UPI003B593BB2
DLRLDVDDIDRGRLRAPAEVARALFPTVDLDDDLAAQLADGKRIPVAVADAPVVAGLHGTRLVGLASVQGGVARVVANFPPEPGTVSP